MRRMAAPPSGAGAEDTCTRALFTLSATALLPTALKVLDKSGLDSKVAQTEFADWLARETWGEPTAEQLLNFANERAVIAP